MDAEVRKVAWTGQEVRDILRVDLRAPKGTRAIYLVHEHPLLATSWQTDVMVRLDGYPDVRKVQTHMCQFGMVKRTGKVGSALGPILKPTGGIARELARKCPRDHEHVHLVGGWEEPVLQGYVEPYVEDWPLNFGKTKQGEYKRR